MSRLKEYYLNSLSEKEIEEMVENHYFNQELLYEFKETLTSQSTEDMGIYQTYPFDN